MKTKCRAWESDRQYETKRIKSAEREGRGCTVSFDDGWCLWVPRSPRLPQPGDEARLFGRGTGFTVRGLVVKGRALFYRTVEESERLDRKRRARTRAKQRVEYRAGRAALALKFAALPASFQSRIAGFRAWSPDWSRNFERYEMFTCEQAVLIAGAFPTEEDIRRFHGRPFGEQKKMLPALSDDHSGNTFGAACRLAMLFVTNADLVPKEHGALCPLVGCKKYGCAAVRAAKE